MDRKEWDMDVMRDLFNERDAQIISSIPLSSSVSTNNWFWKQETSGLYNVKSAYKYLQELKGDWDASMVSDLWRLLYKIRAPPKVIQFLWKVLSGCLPTRAQLQMKHINVELGCLLCHTEVESISHVLLGCSFARSCWHKSVVDLYYLNFVEFKGWFIDLLRRRQPGVIEEVAMISWSIWKARNNLLWMKKMCSANYIVSSARLALDQWKYAQSHKFEPLLVPSGDHQSGCERWTKPVNNVIKINVDGATFEAENAYGAGMLARDHNGQVIEAIAVYKPGCVKPEIAEITGIKEALSWIKKRRWQNILVETDCLVAVQALQSSLQMPLVFGLIVYDCRLLISPLVNVKVFFVKRSANEVAYRLARGFHLWSGRTFIASSIPSAVQEIVMSDSVD